MFFNLTNEEGQVITNEIYQYMDNIFIFSAEKKNNLKQILIQNMLKIRSNIHLVASNIARITNAVQCKTLLLGHYYCNVLRFVSNVKNITSIFDSSYVSKALKITL